MTTTRSRLAAVLAGGAVAAAGLTVAATSAAAGSPATHSAPACGNNALAVARTYVDSGMGHSWMALIYRNASTHTCTVTGYPGLDAIGPKGHVLAHAKRALNGGHVRTITLRPGGYASAGVSWENFDGATGGACAFGAAVNTIVPNTTRVHRLRVSVSRCGLEVNPTVAGVPMYPYYATAQRYWIEGSKVISAKLNSYLRQSEGWLKKAHAYPTQVTQLAQLASFPETGLTPQQVKRACADVKALNEFFGTPGLYS